MSMEQYSPDSHKWPMNRRVYAIEFCVCGVWQWRNASGLFTTATEAKNEARKLRDGIANVRYRVRLLLIGRVVRSFAKRGKYTFKRTANNTPQRMARPSAGATYAGGVGSAEDGQ